MVNPLKWSDVAPHPSQIVCVGDVGSGKTGLMANWFDWNHSEGIQPVLVAPSHVVAQYPKWVKGASPQNIEKLGNDSSIGVDDAHLLYYARESMRNVSATKALDFIGRERRHRNVSLFVNSQQTRVIDVNLLSMVSAICVKRPSLMQIQYARPEFKSILSKARKEFEGHEKDYFKYVYVVGNEVEGELMSNNIPSWFKEETSKSQVSTDVKKPYKWYAPIVDVVRSFG